MVENYPLDRKILPFSVLIFLGDALNKNLRECIEDHYASPGYLKMLEESIRFLEHNDSSAITDRLWEKLNELKALS